MLIDGSVLVNAPFRPAIDALGRRPARRQVDRRFVYIDPFPGMHFRLPGGGGHPGFFQTIVGAISELPRQQPIRDNLEAIAARSGRIDRMQAILAAIREEVEQEIEQLFGGTFFPRPSDRRRTPGLVAGPRTGRRRRQGGVQLCGLWASEARQCHRWHGDDPGGSDGR